MNIEKILQECNIQYASIKEVQEGKDSSVYHITNIEGQSFAIRILPIDRLHQFHWEADLIAYVRERKIPVPEVLAVHSTEEYAVMVMEWAKGVTMLQALVANPERAHPLGFEFGRVQAMIHQISMPKMERETWLTPATEIEKKLLSDIQPNGNSLLHMDFHPLNVLTDGESITAVIDWINASTGDCRFDLVRTLSVMEIDGPTLPELRERLTQFLDGWREGYGLVNGPMLINESFRLWAGNRMKRDIANRLDEDTVKRIDSWMVENIE